jgi:hypothetical protein
VSLFLTPEEIKQLTGKEKRNAQIRALNQMGIVHKVRADGSPVVLESHVNKVLGGSVQTKNKEAEPNWGAMHA